MATEIKIPMIRKHNKLWNSENGEDKCVFTQTPIKFMIEEKPERKKIQQHPYTMLWRRRRNCRMPNDRQCSRSIPFMWAGAFCAFPPIRIHSPIYTEMHCILCYITIYNISASLSPELIIISFMFAFMGVLLHYIIYLVCVILFIVVLIFRIDFHRVYARAVALWQKFYHKISINEIKIGASFELPFVCCIFWLFSIANELFTWKMINVIWPPPKKKGIENISIKLSENGVLEKQMSWHT